MIEIVVDGTDGAGKSSCLTMLKKHLCALGLSVASCAPYRKQEVYHLWEKQPVLAAQTITGIMRDFRDAYGGNDAIIWDRGWPTAFVTTRDERARALFKPFPALTILLLGSVERTRQKARKENLQGVWVNEPELIQTYNRAYHQLENPAGSALLRSFPNARNLFDFTEICQAVEKFVLSPPKELAQRHKDAILQGNTFTRQKFSDGVNLPGLAQGR